MRFKALQDAKAAQIIRTARNIKKLCDITGMARRSLRYSLNANQGDDTMTRNLTAKRYIYTAIGIAGLYAIAHFVALLVTLNGML